MVGVGRGRLCAGASRSHDTIKVKDLFAEALSSISSAAETALGRGGGIEVISKPQHFNGTSTGCLITAAMEVDPLLKLQYQIHPFAKVASLAYGPNSCVDLDFGNWSDYDYEDKQVAMVIDYDTDRIDITIANVMSWGASKIVGKAVITTGARAEVTTQQ
jgi:hypothetical protein